MSLNIDTATMLFTVVGAAYVQEHHFENRDSNSEWTRLSGTALPQSSQAAWLAED
jgi:hypothetical protein